MARRVRRGSSLLVLSVAALVLAFPASGQIPAGYGGVEETLLFDNPTASILEMPKPPATRQNPLGLVPGSAVATPVWWDGGFAYQSFPNFLSDPPTQGNVISQAGYYGANDGSYPLVGQVYLVRIIMAVAGNSSGGGVAESTEAQLPAGTALAVSQQNPVRCWYLAPQAQNWVDATNDPGAGCPTNPGQGTLFPINLGTRAVPNFSQFAIHVPVYSTRVLSGIGDSANSTLTMMALSFTTTPGQVFPYQWVWVFDNPPTFDTLQAINITDSSARTQGWLRNHYKSGNVFFDIGETTSYGFTAGPYSIANTYDAASLFQGWTLTPGTTYHWRMRFVPTIGTAVASTDQVFTTTGTPPPTTPLTPGDFQGDGKADVLWRHNSSGGNVAWLMNAAAVAASGGLPVVSDMDFKIVGIGDFQGDGKADVLWRNSATGANVMWLMDGMTVAVGAMLPAVLDTTWTVAGVGDFQGDGKADILWRNTSSGNNSIWFMDGPNYVATAALTPVFDTNWKVAAIGDFQNDGKADVIWRHAVSGANSVWLMNGGNVAVSAGLPTVPDANWKIVGVGDFQNDGYDDALWRHSSTGSNSIWFMAGAGLATSAALSPVGDVNWGVAKVGDFQGDGKADIMWRNAVSGANAQWLMNGPNIAVSSSLPTVMDTGWQVASTP